ncbi:MAG: hypothetical protein WA828_00310 [Coleofasciculaceae cyanobacterium]
MSDINDKESTTAMICKNIIRPRLLFQSLAFTGILYLSVGQPPPDPTEAINRFPQTRSALSFGNPNTKSLLSPGFEKSVLQHASKQLGLPTSALRITQAQSQTWSDNCLEIHDPQILCTKTPVPGWQVKVASTKQSWIYRTNASGSLIKIELQTNKPASASQLALKTRSSKSDLLPNSKN